jgi:peptidoglycan/LPS O-acetylase OafA/YrhL
MTSSGQPLAPLAGNRVPELDGVRALAILSVLFWHWIHLPGLAGGKLHMLTRMTWSGVDLFFVLSGYLIGGILMHNRDSDPYFKPFFIRRLFRIMPLYLLLLALALAAASPAVLSRWPELTSAFSFRQPPWTFFLQVQNIAMAWSGVFAQQSLTVTWSLALEEQFYLILPFLLRWTPPAAVPWLSLGLIASAPLLRLALLQAYPERANFWAYLLLPCRWDALFAGVLAAWWWRRDSGREWLHRRRWALLAALALMNGVVAWMTVTARGVIMSGFMTQGGYTILALFYFLFLLAVLTFQRHWLSGCLRWPPLVLLGVTSYGVYLWHEPLRTLVARILEASGLGQGEASWAGLLITLPTLAIVVALSWRYLERPALELGQRFRYGGARRASGGGAELASPPGDSLLVEPDAKR